MSVREKGGHTHRYKISRAGAKAIADYLRAERGGGSDAFSASSALFLPAGATTHSQVCQSV